MQDIEELQKIQTRASEGSTKLEQKEIELEESLEKLSHYLDGVFRIPGIGWRFGLDSLIGLVPSVGDLSTSVVSFYILIAGVRYGVPKITLLRMAFNIGLDYVVGIIPFVGDAFDFVWKANKQNVDLIRKHGEGLGEGTTSDYIFVFLIIAVLIGILAGSIFVGFLVLASIFSGLWNLLGL